MAAGSEISGEKAAAATVMAASSAVLQQSSLENKVAVAKTDENASINVANFDGGSVVPNFGSNKGPNSGSISGSRMQDIADVLSSLKLNPMAKEFFPSSYPTTDHYDDQPEMTLNYLAPAYDHSAFGNQIEGYPNYNRRRGNNDNQGRRFGRSFQPQREDNIRRTVYVSDIDHNVSEEQLAAAFSICGQVLDCRVCGDPYSRSRFAFVEFADENAARAALNLSGMMLGVSQVKVSPSKTAILPVNPTFLPQSEYEKEMCARTIYCTNIDKRVTQAEVKYFFETRCGEVSRLRLLGDHVHPTRIAFVEFVNAESAIMALDCCGELLGNKQIRVSPSKTPVRPRGARALLTN